MARLCNQVEVLRTHTDSSSAGTSSASSVPDALSPNQATLLLTRAHLLSRLDLLHTYTQLHGPRAAVRDFYALADAGLPAAAAAFARTARLRELSTILTNHGVALGRDALTALSEAPETVDAAAMTPLIAVLLAGVDGAPRRDASAATGGAQLAHIVASDRAQGVASRGPPCRLMPALFLLSSCILEAVHLARSYQPGYLCWLP